MTKLSAVKSPETGTVSIRLVWPFVDLARQSGHTDAVRHIETLLGRSDAELEDPDARIPLRLAADLLDYGIALSGCRNLGLSAAEIVDASHVGISEYLARSLPTLRDALECAAQYDRLLGDGTHQSIVVDGTSACVRLWLEPEVVTHEAAYEFMTALCVLRLRRLAGRHALQLREVHFMHVRPADTTRHETLFGCPVHFGMPFTQAVLPAEVLDLPMSNAEPGLNALLQRRADAMLASLPPANDLVQRVRALLAMESSLRDASVERVARRLEMSVRTLARRLSEQGTSYRDLLDETRMRAALRELEQSARPISEIALLLGFATSQSFHRAFRRWTGSTAASFREQAYRQKRSA